MRSRSANCARVACAKAQKRLNPAAQRAVAQIGKLSRELDKGKPGPEPKIGLTDETQPDKVDQLKTAGISKATANRYEQLGRRSERANALQEAMSPSFLWLRSDIARKLDCGVALFGFPCAATAL